MTQQKVGIPFQGSEKTHKTRDQKRRAKKRLEQLRINPLFNQFYPTGRATVIPDISSLDDFPILEDFPRIVEIIDHRNTSSSSRKTTNNTISTAVDTGMSSSAFVENTPALQHPPGQKIDNINNASNAQSYPTLNPPLSEENTSFHTTQDISSASEEAMNTASQTNRIVDDSSGSSNSSRLHPVPPLSQVWKMHPQQQQWTKSSMISLVASTYNIMSDKGHS